MSTLINLSRRVVWRLVPVWLIRKIRERKRALMYEEQFATKMTRYRRLVDQQVLGSQEGMLAKLRMHAHITDKGLHREDWEPEHGVRNYHHCKALLETLEGVQDPTYFWAKSIAEEYERRLDSSARMFPPFGVPSSPCTVSPELLTELLESRTSSRVFTDQLITEDQVEKIVAAALEAPSSCNRQAIKVYASVNPDKAGRIACHFIGFTGFSDFVPAVIVFCMDLRPYIYPSEFFTPTLDAGLAVENAALMACAMGLSMTQMIWTGEEDRDAELRSLLEIPDCEEIMVGAVCGYPRRAAVRPVRKRITEALSFR